MATQYAAIIHATNNTGAILGVILHSYITVLFLKQGSQAEELAQHQLGQCTDAVLRF